MAAKGGRRGPFRRQRTSRRRGPWLPSGRSGDFRHFAGWRRHRSL